LPIVLPDVKNPSEEFNKAIEESISVVDASGTNLDLFSYVVELNKSEKNRNFQHQYIGTSGLLAHGDSASFAVEKTRPSFAPEHPLAARMGFENNVVLSEHVKGNVIRPGGVYGYDGYLGIGSIPRFFAAYFMIGENDELEIYGKRDKYFSVVHVKDLAAAYVLMVDSGAHGKIYDLAAESVQYEQLQIAACKASGWKGNIKHIASKDIPPEKWFERLMADVSVRTVGSKARKELGWNPKRVGFLHELDIYYRACKAQREASQTK
jgi:nucleoside-diphosphate-sugar epimerase